MKIYLGSSKLALLDKCPDCVNQKSNMPFRNVYMTEVHDKRFESVIFYTSTPGLKLYEMILLAKPGQDINRIAKDLLGSPNTNNEWRFSPDETGLNFMLAMWIYKNKLIIAGSLAGSEWESGFE